LGAAALAIGVCDMSISRKIGLGAATFALLATSASPALARGGNGYGWNNWDGGGYGRHHRRRDRDNDTGEILGGVLIGAILVGVLSSASKKKRQQREAGGLDYPDQNNRADRNRGDIATEDQAVDACASAAESRAGRTASVRDVDQVRRNSDGWDVEGIVESRDTWRDRSADSRRFTCSVRFGAVGSVYVEDPKVAFAD
jgi:hypothetical protein